MELALTAGQVTFDRGLLEYLGITPDGKISVSHAPDGHLDIAAAEHRDSTDEMLAQLKALNDAWDGEKIHLTIEEIPKCIENHCMHFYPALASKLCSFKAALFMGHALYWTRHLAEKNPQKDGWFYLSAKQCEAATGLTTREQGGVRRLLRELGLIDEKRAGVPATMHYRINLPAMLEWAGLHKAWRGTDALTAIEMWLGDSIRFYKPLADCAGSIAGGLYLSLLVQKQREWMAADGFSHVPQHRISELLAWGAKTQRNAREKLKARGLLQERKRGAWIRVDMQTVMKEIAPNCNWYDIDGRNETQPSLKPMLRVALPPQGMPQQPYPPQQYPQQPQPPQQQQPQNQPQGNPQ